MKYIIPILLATLFISCDMSSNSDLDNTAMQDTVYSIDSMIIHDTLLSIDSLIVYDTIHSDSIVVDERYDRNPLLSNDELTYIHSNVRMLYFFESDSEYVHLGFSDERDHENQFKDSLYILDLNNKVVPLLLDSILVSPWIESEGWSIRYKATQKIDLSYPRYVTNNKKFRFDPWKYQKDTLENTTKLLEDFKQNYSTELADLHEKCEGNESEITMRAHVSLSDSVEVYINDFRRDTVLIFSTSYISRVAEGIFPVGYAFKKIGRLHNGEFHSMYTTTNLMEEFYEPFVDLDKNGAIEFTLVSGQFSRYIVEPYAPYYNYYKEGISFSMEWNEDYPEGEMATTHPLRYYNMVLK